jgi:hypothetical protein
MLCSNWLGWIYMLCIQYFHCVVLACTTQKFKMNLLLPQINMKQTTLLNKDLWHQKAVTQPVSDFKSTILVIHAHYIPQ